MGAVHIELKTKQNSKAGCIGGNVKLGLWGKEIVETSHIIL